MESDFNICENKAALRCKILAARDALPLTARQAASERITAQIVALPSFVAAQRVLLFHPFGSEWDAGIVIAEAIRQNKTVVLPRVDGTTKTMALHRVDNMEHDTAPGVFGIREPLSGTPCVAPETLDWLLVPGLVFSPQCDRLGYGAGYYDCLLEQIPPNVPLIAGAFDVQMVAELPTETHDKKVDQVITETQTYQRAFD